MPLSDLNQLNLGRSTGTKVPKTLSNPINIKDIKVNLDKKKKVSPKVLSEELYTAWYQQPSNKNLSDLLGSLQPQIDKSISALVSKPTAAVKSKAKLLTLKAIRSYDPKSKTKLSTWVYNQLQPLKRYTQQSVPVPVSERMFRRQAELFKFEEDFYNNHNRYPSDRELSDLMKLSKKQLSQIRKFSKARVYELQQYGEGDENSATASETMGMLPDRMEEIIDLFYDSLSPTEQTILEYRLGLRGRKKLNNNLTATKVGLSPARVSQISGALADQLDQFKSTAEGII